MRFFTWSLIVCFLVLAANAQFFNNLRNFFRRPFGGGGGGGLFNTRPRFRDDGTQSPQSTGRDEILPSDCGRNVNTGRGNLCFPDGLLCQQRVNRVGNSRFGNHVYWFSWKSDRGDLRNTKWDWFNARNYCRKRCMDLVSFETREEYEWVKRQLGGVDIWTSGRLCNFDGCDKPQFFPKNIKGWFWSANQVTIPPTNTRQAANDWAPGTPGTGESRACLAVSNGQWRDETCEVEKAIVCEDTEGHLNFARRTFPNINIP